MQDRCSYLTACVIVKLQQSSSMLDVAPLVECVEEVERLVGQCGRRGRFGRVIKAEHDKHEIANLHGRMGHLTQDMGLGGIVVVHGKVDNLVGTLENLIARQDQNHAEQMAQLVREVLSTVLRILHCLTMCSNDSYRE